MDQGGYQNIRQLSKDTILMGKLENNQLLLRVFIGFENKVYKQYDARIRSLMSKALKNKCHDNLQQFLQLLKTHQNVRFQASHLILETSEGIGYVYLSGMTIQREMKAETIEELIKKCGDTKNFKQEDFGNIMKTLLRIVLWHTQLLEKKKNDSSPLKITPEPLKRQQNNISMKEKMLIRKEQNRKFTDSSSKTKQSANSRSNNLKPTSIQDKQILRKEAFSFFFDEYWVYEDNVAINASCITNMMDSGIHIHREKIEKRVFRVIFQFKQIKQAVFIGMWDPNSKDRFIYLNSGIYFQRVNQKERKPLYLRGYKIGEQVTMLVNMQEGSIQWKMKDERILKIEDQELIYSGNWYEPWDRWVPVIWLSSNGDSVEIKD